MKAFAVVLFSGLFSVLALHGQALADQSAQVTLTAQDSSKIIQITDQTFEPIYSEVPYDATCSQQVVDHTETRCETTSDTVCSGGGEVCSTTNDSVCNSKGCTTVPRRSCRSTPQSCTSVPRRSCSDYNVYRTEYYSCTKYRTEVTGHKLVKTFNHQIEVSLAQPEAIGAASLQIEVDVSQDTVRAKLSSSYAQGLLNYQVSNVSESDGGSVLNSSKKIVISSGLSAEILKEIASSSLQNLALGHNAIRFELPGVADLAQNLKIAIKLVRNRAIFGDKTLYNSSVASSKLGLTTAGADVKALIPFQKLGIKSINSLRYDLAVSVSLDDGNVLNIADFSDLFAKKLSASFVKIKASF